MIQPLVWLPIIHNKNVSMKTISPGNAYNYLKDFEY